MKSTEQKATILEAINSELFTTFEPSEEAWVVGGSGSASGSATYNNGADGGGDVDYDW